MKNLGTLLFLCLCVFFSCERYDDSLLFVEIDHLKGKVDSLSQENDQLKHADDGLIKAFYFKVTDNTASINEDVYGVVADSTISVHIPNLCLSKTLKPTIEFYNEHSYVDAPQAEYDFSRPVVITTKSDVGGGRCYHVNLTSFTGLPVLYIDTEDRKEVTSKETYIQGSYRLVDDAQQDNPEILSGNVSIKGRGNSSWNLPKKPYQIKFDTKTSLFGFPKDKTWVLLANYSDKTALRNETAFYISRLSELEWTPRTRFVEVIINDVYQGTYQLCEKIKVSKDRVNVGDDGYLLEVDQLDRLDPDDVYFRTSRILLNVKEPEALDPEGEQYAWIKDYITNVEDVLYSDDFLDAEKGYKNYVDINSFVDWYLINEISRNNDAVFWSSCYMNIKKDEKLKMGPVWDFDIAFGNVTNSGNYNPEGLWVYNSLWIKRMFDDPEFIALVKNRFNYFYSHKNDIIAQIAQNASMLQYAVVENNNKWNTFYTKTWQNSAIMGSYNNEVNYLKQWLLQRFEWLKATYAEM